MIVERYIPDFWVWLLGPGWRSGVCFPWFLYLLGTILLAGLVWAGLVGGGWVRWHFPLTASQSRRIGRVLGYGTLGFTFLVLLLMGLVMAHQAAGGSSAPHKPADSSAPSDSPPIESAQIVSVPQAIVRWGEFLFGPGWTEGRFMNGSAWRRWLPGGCSW